MALTFSENKIQVSSNDALIIVDLQNDFLSGGSLEVPNGNQIIASTNNISRKFKEKGAIIILTQDWHPSNHYSFASQHKDKSPFDPIDGIKGIGPVLWPDHCVQGEKGSEFHPNLDTTVAHLIIRKGFNKMVDSYSCFLENDKATETGLDGYLKTLSVKRLFVCGLALDYCVYFSALDGKAKEYEVYIIHDLTRGIAEESIQTAEQKMQDRGIIFLKSDQLLF